MHFRNPTAVPIGDFLAFNDVNDRQWIVGLHDIPPIQGAPDFDRQGFLLIPDPCPGDVDSDGNTDGTDLAMLLGAWGTSPSEESLLDIDIDGDVGASDLAILLGSWGACPDVCAQVACGENSNSVQFGGENASVAAEAAESAGNVDLLLSTFGQPSLEAFHAWFATLNQAERDSVLLAISLLFGG